MKGALRNRWLSLFCISFVVTWSYAIPKALPRAFQLLGCMP